MPNTWNAQSMSTLLQKGKHGPYDERMFRLDMKVIVAHGSVQTLWRVFLQVHVCLRVCSRTYIRNKIKNESFVCGTNTREQSKHSLASEPNYQTWNDACSCAYTSFGEKYVDQCLSFLAVARVCDAFAYECFYWLPANKNNAWGLWCLATRSQHIAV